jgi:hypothetical protein
MRQTRHVSGGGVLAVHEHGDESYDIERSWSVISTAGQQRVANFDTLDAIEATAIAMLEAAAVFRVEQAVASRSAIGRAQQAYAATAGESEGHVAAAEADRAAAEVAIDLVYALHGVNSKSTLVERLMVRLAAKGTP